MSHSASIDVTLAKPFAFSRVLEVLSQAGWTLDAEDAICYLPPGHGDGFEWTNVAPAAREEVLAHIRQMDRAGEFLGIVVTWQDTGIGGQLLMLEDRATFSLSLTVRRRLLERCGRATDFSWYVGRLLEPVIAAGLAFESVRCAEHV